MKDAYSSLYRNCQSSDFAVYTIPTEVSDYGLSRKDVGKMVFEDIIRSGYDGRCRDYDRWIDYTYGSLRNRDTQVERIGKKYQEKYIAKLFTTNYKGEEYYVLQSYQESSEQKKEDYRRVRIW